MGGNIFWVRGAEWTLSMRWLDIFYGWVGVGGGRRRYILGKYGRVNIFHG